MKILFYLKFLADENFCDTKFFESGEDSLSGIDTNAEVAEVRYEPLDNTVVGEIKRRGGLDTACKVASEGGFIWIQLRMSEDHDGTEEDDWEISQNFKHPSDQTSFRFDLGELHGLHEGKDYRAQLRFEIRPGLASHWVPFQFKAREAPKVKITNSDPMVLEVGKASSLRATIEAGVPEPTITWKKKGSDEVLSTTNTLYFPNPTEAEQGVYVVEVRNLDYLGSDRQEILVDVKDTIADQLDDFDTMFEAKMRSRLDKELEKFSAMISQNSDIIRNIIGETASIRQNNSTQNKIISGNTKAISDTLTQISGNSATITKNATSIRKNSAMIRRNSTSFRKNSNLMRNLTRQLSLNLSSVNKLSKNSSHAAYQDAWSSHNRRITFDRLLLKSGEGVLNAGSGIFTCGYGGTYLVSWSLLVNPASMQANWVFLHRNGHRVQESELVFSAAGPNAFDNGARTMLLSLKNRETLWLEAGRIDSGLQKIMFSVQLVAAE